MFGEPANYDHGTKREESKKSEEYTNVGETQQR